jgi:hypothetical protein
MKLFIYKLLVSLVAIYILFQLTIGLMLKDFEKKIIQIKSQENIELIKSKIREELTNGIDKDSILSAEDAKLIRDFFKKISSEINSN